MCTLFYKILFCFFVFCFFQYCCGASTFWEFVYKLCQPSSIPSGRSGPVYRQLRPSHCIRQLVLPQSAWSSRSHESVLHLPQFWWQRAANSWDNALLCEADGRSLSADLLWFIFCTWEHVTPWRDVCFSQEHQQRTALFVMVNRKKEWRRRYFDLAEQSVKFEL